MAWLFRLTLEILFVSKSTSFLPVCDVTESNESIENFRKTFAMLMKEKRNTLDRSNAYGVDFNLEC